MIAISASSKAPDPHHEGFRRAAFLRGTAVIAHAPRHLVLGEPVFHGRGGEQGGGAEQIVAAAMAVAAGFQRPRFRHARFLTEARQGIVFAEEGDDGSAFAPFAHQRGGNPGDLLGDAETLMAQFGQMFGRRARLGVAHFGHRPDPVAQVDEARLDGVDAAPDITAIIHLPIPDAEGEVSGELLSASQNDASAWRSISHAAGAGASGVATRARTPAGRSHLHAMRPEQPAFLHHQHHGERGQRAEEEAGRERHQRAVVILADGDADADAEQRRDRAVQRRRRCRRYGPAAPWPAR